MTNTASDEARVRTPAEEHWFGVFCRQPGTRIADILARIERGEDFGRIAQRYRTDEVTIGVYAAALRNELSRIPKQVGPEYRRPGEAGPLPDGAVKAAEDGETPPGHRTEDRCAWMDDWPYEVLEPMAHVWLDGKWIRIWLKRNGLTMEAAGRRADMKPEQLSQMLRRGRTTLRTLNRLRKALGVDFIELGLAGYCERE